MSNERSMVTWPREAGHVVHTEMTSDEAGELVMRTVVAGADYNTPNSTNLVIETWEDEEVNSFALVELRICGDDSRTGEDELSTGELFTHDLSEQIDEYLAQEWQHRTRTRKQGGKDA